MYEIKRLKMGNNVFVPQTVAEAVLLKDGSEVTTLDKVINRKISAVNSSEGSGITVNRTGN